MALVWPANDDSGDYADYPQHISSHHKLFSSTLPALFAHPHHVENMMNPECDVRETTAGYWVDISLPGVSDSETIGIECPTSRQLTVTSKVHRPWIPAADKLVTKGTPYKHGDAERQAQAQNHGNGDTLKQHEPQHQNGDTEPRLGVEPQYQVIDSHQKTELQHGDQDGPLHHAFSKKEKGHYEPRFLVAERNVGHFNRTFSFALDVDEAKIRAKLEYGLLSIEVPKLVRKAFRQIKVDASEGRK